jgi:ATP-dependent Clp protease protease subunit
MTMPSFPPEFPGEPARREPGTAPSPPAFAAPGAADLLLERRIVLADGHLDGLRATELSARLMMLDVAGNEPVALHLRTPDGDLEAAFALADTIGILGCPVHALVAGQAGGPALLVLAAAGRREMTPHATLRLTEPRAHLDGGAEEVAAAEEEHRRRLDAYYARLAEVSGREMDEIRQDARAGRLLTAEQAVGYGLADAVVRAAPSRP